MRPISIPPNVLKYNKNSEALLPEVPQIVQNFKNIFSDTPDISIVIPAYNEEDNILKTLFSLSNTNTK